MNVPARLAAFGLALVLAFGIGAALGAAVGPDPASPGPTVPMVTEADSPAPTAPMEHGAS